MNIDDPRLTAYALDDCEHLGAAEREAIAAALSGDPKLAGEVSQLRGLTARLRAELHAEKAEPLTAAQRAEILTSSAARDRVIVAPRHRWWRSQMVGLSVAACAVIGLSTAVFYQAEHVRHLEVQQERALARERTVSTDEVVVGVELKPQGIDLDAAPMGAVIPQLPELTAAAPAKPGSVTTWTGQPGAIPQINGPVDGLQFSDSSLGVAPALPLPATPTPSTPFGSEAALGERGRADDRVQMPAAVTAPPVPAQIDAFKASSSPVAAPRPAPVARAKGSGSVVAGRGFSLGDSAAGVSGLSTGGATYEYRADEPVPATLRAERESKALRGDVLTDGAKLSASAATPTGGPTAESEVEIGRLGKRVELLRRDIQAEQDGASNTEAYDAIKENPFLTAKENPLSTFSIDVDTGSYSNVRRFLNANQRPPKGAVRIEEMVNYFRYDYPQPKDKDPFGATLEVATCPWTPAHRLVRVGIKGREIPRNERPAANLVFLVDVSGSMEPANKLPLVKEALRLLTDQLGPDDSVSIAVYAGASGCVLEPTHDKEKVRTVLSKLESGGSTNGAAGIQLAYDLAQRAFKKGGSNRVILCTDGDFNVGTTDQSQLVSLIEGKAKTGIFLSVLGFGYGNLKDSTLEKLADKGNGYYGYIDTIAEGRRLFVEQLAGTLCTIAKDVKIQVEFNPAQVGSYRLIGYENRLLAKEDFNDDTKDAGEIGAGHTVTALYEVVPPGQAVSAALAGVDELKYQAQKAKDAPTKADVGSSEMLTVKVRYKQPEGETSAKVEFPLTDSGTTWERSSRDFRWAAAVTGFGMMLRDSGEKGSLSWGLVEELAAEGRTENGNTERAEFVQLVEKARAVSR